MGKRTFTILAAALIFCMLCLPACGLSSGLRSVGPEEYFGIADEDSAALIVDGEICQEKAKAADGAVWIPQEFVWQGIEPGFFFEESSGRLYFTSGDGESVWTQDDGSGTLRIIDGVPYISAERVNEYSAAQIKVFEDPARAVIQTPGRERMTATITEDAPLTVRAGNKGGVLTGLTAGEQVVYLSDEDGWSRVSTKDGFTGFVDTDCLADIAEAAIGPAGNDGFTKKSFDGTVRMVWDYIDFPEDNDGLGGMAANVKGVNVIAPTWYALTGEPGGVSVLSDAGYVRNAHGMGMQVWPLISDLTLTPENVGQVLGTKESRSRIIDLLMTEADTLGFDGINVDFEYVDEKTVPAFIQFIRELTLFAHEKDLIVSVNDYVPEFTQYYNRGAQIEACDYIIVMAYDEHTAGSKEIGSTASLPFAEKGVSDTLREVPPECLILGVPFYSRAWTQNFGESEFSSDALDMESARSFIREHGIDAFLYWDQDAGQFYGTATDETARYSIWFEEGNSLAQKLSLVGKYSLAGAAAWRLGYEEDSVWDTWAEQLTGSGAQ